MSIPTTQKALYLESARGAWRVGTNDVPTPAPGSDELLVRVESSALNPVDWKVHDYDFGVPSYPAILGSDVAGVVVAAADGVKGDVKVGDNV